MSPSSNLRIERRGRLGHITLDRPATLNSLDHGMILGSSLVATFGQLRRGAGLDLDQTLIYEYRMSIRMMAAHDFREGVRAALVDRDRGLRWRPDRLADVDVAAVEALSLEDGDLEIR